MLDPLTGQQQADPVTGQLIFESTANGPTSFATGDFDGDGAMDLAMGMPGCSINVGIPHQPPQWADGAGAVIVCFGNVVPEGQLCGMADQDCRRIADPLGPQAGAMFGAAVAAWPVPAVSTNPLPLGYLSAPPPHGLIVGVPNWLDNHLDIRTGSVRGIFVDRAALKNWNTAWVIRPTDFGLGEGSPHLDGADFGASLAVMDYDIDPPPYATDLDLAVGAPGLPQADGVGGLYANVGGVEVFSADISSLRTGNASSPLILQEPPFYPQGREFRPLAVCGAGPEPACEDQDTSSVCEGARFGETLVAGRFIEDADREDVEDLAVGAPGSAGAEGQPDSGHVEVLSGGRESSTGLPAEIITRSPCGPDLYIDQRSLGAGINRQGDISAGDYAPEVGDRYGAALAKADLVRTIFADSDGAWKDELLVGAPGESLAWFSYGATGIPVGWGAPNAVVETGTVCSVLFDDMDVALEISEEPPFEILGVPPAEPEQQCWGLVASDASPEHGLAFDGADWEHAHFGAAIAAGRLSTWDPTVQLVVGAPGEVGNASPRVDQGAVYALHLNSNFNTGLWLSAASAVAFVEPRADLVRGSDMRTMARPVYPSQLGSAAIGQFGAALHIADFRCGGVADLVVSAPDDRNNEVWEGAYFVPWAQNPDLNTDWSQIYEVSSSGSPPYDMKVAVAAATGFADGYTYQWSASNVSHNLSMEMICSVFANALEDMEADMVGELDGEGNVITAAEADARVDELRACNGLRTVGAVGEACDDLKDGGDTLVEPSFPMPVNALNLPAGLPFPVDYLVTGCSALPGPQPGQSWAQPLAGGFYGFDSPLAESFELGGLVETSSGIPTFSGDLFAGLGFVQALPESFPVELIYDMMIRKVDPLASPTGAIDLCMSVDGLFGPVDPLSKVNGIESDGCFDIPSSDEGLIHWTLEPQAPLTCDRAWRP